MKQIQSRSLNVASIVLGALLVLLAVSGVVEALWMDGLRGLVDARTIILGVAFLSLGVWCGLGGWKNLRATRRGS